MIFEIRFFLYTIKVRILMKYLKMPCNVIKLFIEFHSESFSETNDLSLVSNLK